MFKMIPEIIITVIVAAFILEFFDSSVGMGFGTLTPVLILMGYPPLQVIPAVLLCSAILSITAGLLHHQMGNVDFRHRQTQKIIGVLLGFGIIGIIIGAFTALHIPEKFLEGYIGFLTLGIGILILKNYSMKRKLSWNRMIGFGSLAAFNKGISGGGFGPVVSGGQIISGVRSKRAVGITSLTEGILSAVGVAGYILLDSYGSIDWQLILSLLIGGLLSLPIAVYALKRLNPKKVRMAMGMISIILGILVLIKMFMI